MELFFRILHKQQKRISRSAFYKDIKLMENKESNIKEICNYCGYYFNTNEMKKISLGNNNKIYFHSCKSCTESLNYNYLKYSNNPINIMIV